MTNTFEYKRLELDHPVTEDELNEQHEEGWMLVTLATSSYRGMFWVYLARRVETESWADKAYSDLRRNALEATPE